MTITQLKFGSADRFKADWSIVRSFFDNLPYPVVELSGQGRDMITYCNSAFSNILEFQPQDLIGEDISTFASDETELKRLGQDFRRPLGDRNLMLPFIAILQNRTGQAVPLALDIMERTSDSGEDLGFLIIAQQFDRSDPNSSHAFRQIFYDIVERSGEAIAVIAEDGTFLFRNPAHKTLFGQTDRPVGELTVRDFLEDDQDGQIRPDVWEGSQESGEWVGLLNGVTPDGIKPIWVRTHAMNDPVSEKPIHFSFLHDYSKELARLNELADAKRSAEEARQTQRHLFHAVSHDLRTILQAASLYLEIADRKITRKGDKIDEIGRARDAIYSVQDHFQRILDVVSSDATFFKPKIEYIKSQEILDYAFHTYRALADAKGIELHANHCTCLLATDASLMKRTVGNLISNAIKFTAKGSVTVSGLQTEDRCGIEVRDTGVGVPEEFREKIFDQFYRINPREQEGLGIGLSISMQICELLGHEIEVSSNDAGGAVFTVWAARVQQN